MGCCCCWCFVQLQWHCHALHAAGRQLKRALPQAALRMAKQKPSSSPACAWPCRGSFSLSANLCVFSVARAQGGVPQSATPTSTLSEFDLDAAYTDALRGERGDVHLLRLAHKSGPVWEQLSAQTADALLAVFTRHVSVRLPLHAAVDKRSPVFSFIMCTVCHSRAHVVLHPRLWLSCGHAGWLYAV
jgi:hypothetical protein